MKTKISAALNLAMAVIVPASWLFMFYRWETSGEFAASGWSSLKYFTVLSNLLMGVVALVCTLKWKSVPGNKALSFWKLMATAAVGLTFTVVVTFLGPTSADGFFSMFLGANFFMHFLTPVIAAADYMFFYPDELKLSARMLIPAVLPMVLYGIFYLGNIMINGLGTEEAYNDWYGFMRWGLQYAGLVFLIALAVTFLLAFLFWKAHNRMAVSQKENV